MTAESIKLQLTRPAIDRLFAENPEAELTLKKQACREIVSKHFHELADAELWRLSHGMSDSISAEVTKLVKDFAAGKKEPTGRSRWFATYPLQDKVSMMIEKAFESHMSEETDRIVKKVIERLQIGSETFEDTIERAVLRKVRATINNTVEEETAKCLDAAVEKAIAARPMSFKLVEEG